MTNKLFSRVRGTNLLFLIYSIIFVSSFFIIIHYIIFLYVEMNDPNYNPVYWADDSFSGLFSNVIGQTGFAIISLSSAIIGMVMGISVKELHAPLLNFLNKIRSSKTLNVLFVIMLILSIIANMLSILVKYVLMPLPNQYLVWTGNGAAELIICICCVFVLLRKRKLNPR